MFTVIALILVALPFVQRHLQKQSAPVPTNLAAVEPSPMGNQVLGADIGKRMKTSGCVTYGKLPDSLCTPGDIFPEVTASQVCVPGYSKNVRSVPESEKNDVYAEYGITTHTTGEYEVDHLVSLELGGSNDVANLWPEAAEPRPGFHEKDLVENYLHLLVCSGSMTLLQAQNMIATDWQKVVLPAR